MRYLIFLAFVLGEIMPGSAQAVQWEQSANNYSTGRLAIGTNAIGKRFEVRANESDHLAYFGNTHASGYGLYLYAALDPLRIVPYSGGNYLFVVTGNGNVGLGVNSPLNKLTAFGSESGTQVNTKPIAKFINSGNAYSKFIIGSDNSNYDAVFSMDNSTTLANTKFRMYIGNGTQATTGHNNDQFVLTGAGNIGIGTIIPDAKLTVKGNVHAEEIIVDLNVPGPDYVFSRDYKLTTLEALKAYIDQYKHLPEIPTAEELSINGVVLGEMNMLLLKKVEELTLYLIDQNAKLGELNEIILRQNERISHLENTENGEEK